MSKSKNVWSKYAEKPDYVVRRESVRERDFRGRVKRDVRVLVDSILEDTLDESGDE
jgi:hypothetical protein